MVYIPIAARDLLQGSAMQRIRSKMNQQQEILRLIKQVLPAQLALHCLDCLEKETDLSLYTDSPVWSSQLRFFVPGMLERLNSSGKYGFREIRLRVLRKSEPTSQQKAINFPNALAVDVIRQSGENMAPSDLADALKRLARTLEEFTDKP